MPNLFIEALVISESPVQSSFGWGIEKPRGVVLFRFVFKCELSSA